MKNLLRILLVAFLVCVSFCDGFAQLKKNSETGKIKSFTNGSVTLFKSIVDNIEVFSVSLPNNNSVYGKVVLFLGNADETKQNLHDFSVALEEGKKGEAFEFSAVGQKYQLYYDKVLGQVCFKVQEEISMRDNFGRFYKATIDDIIKFLEE